MTLPRSSRLRALALAAAVAGTAGIAAAPASADVSLQWSTINAFASGCSTTGIDCTWLGYATNPTPGAGTRGTATPIAPATGPTITPTSPRGAGQVVTWSMPATSGSVSPIALRGDISFAGGLSFVSPSAAQRLGHGFTVTLENPRVVLDGDGTGQLFTSGMHTVGAPDSAPVPYDQSRAAFDLSGIVWAVNADGSYSLTATPAIAETGWVFPANYVTGAGPDRTPNTFGSFTIAMSPATGPKGDKGDAGAKGDKGDNGTAGRNGKNGKNGKTVYIQTSSLRSAPFKGKAARKVRVTKRNGKKVVATGTVKGRTLKVTLKGKKALKGSYTLRVVGKKATATVRIP